MKTVWASKLTADMVEGLDPDTIAELVNALDEVVQQTCEEYGL